jgi:hypothetical protein
MKPFGLDRWWIIPSNPKAILGKTSQKRSLWSSLVIFEGRILGKNRQLIKFEFVEEPWKASHHFTKLLEQMLDQHMKITLILRIYLYICLN